MSRFRLFIPVRFDGLAALRAWVLLAGFLGVNALAVVVITGLLSGRAAGLLCSAALLMVAATSLSIPLSGRARRILLNPESADLYEAEAFVFLGVLTLVMGILVAQMFL